MHDPKLGTRDLAAFGLVAASLLIGQIVLSRLFAATVGYYYAFMLVSLAMLGLGAGGILVQQAASFFRFERFGWQAPALCIAMGASAWGGTLGLLRIYPDLARAENLWTLGAMFWCLFPLFLAGGVLVSLVLFHARERFHVVYGVDLVSAALGCLVAVAVLASMSPVLAMLTAVAILPLVAGVLFSLGRAGAVSHRVLTAICATLAVAAIGGAAFVHQSTSLANPRHLDWLAREQLVSRWNAFSNVTVYRGPFFTWSLSTAYRGPARPMLDVLIDGVGGTEVVAFDGKPESLADYDYLDYDMTYLGHVLTPPQQRQLIIGPGGGVDILQAYRHGRRDITIVEINPLVEQVVNEDLAAFSGRPYHLPGVKVHIDNGRTFIKRSDEKWGLITLTWVDTGGSATAMAFSENYLYTVDAYRDFFERLEPDGMFAFMRALGRGERVKVDAMRGISVAYEALREMGVADPGQHMIVAATASPAFGNRAMCYVLVKRSPYTPSELTAAKAFLDSRAYTGIWLPGAPFDVSSLPDGFAPYALTIRDIVQATDRERLVREARFDIMPTTDDNPFYFAERAGPNREAGAAVGKLVDYLAILAVLVIPLFGIPMIPILRRTRRIGGAGASAIGYFALLGVAFMLVEIEFFHLFAMVLGSPTYAISVVLASLLIFSGLGSLQGERMAKATPGRLAAAFLALAAVLALFSLARQPLLSVLIVQPLWLRILGTALVLAPTSFLMGLPMSTGMSLCRHRPDVMLWGWALNGALSVFASVAAVYFALHYGISKTFALGMVCYVVAGVLVQVFRRRPLPEA